MAAGWPTLTGARARAMWVMTFHSACVRILRREAEQVRLPLVVLHLRPGRLAAADDAWSAASSTWTPRITRPRPCWPRSPACKNELIDYERCRPAPTAYREKALAEAYAEYQRRLVAAGAMDFDDLIMVTVNLLQAFPDVAAELPGAVPARARG